MPEAMTPTPSVNQDSAGADDDRYTRITLRIPKALHARLQAEADSTSKSMNAEIIARVETSFGSEACVAVTTRSFSGQVHAYLNQLLSTGLWGNTEEAVVEQLVYRKLSEMLAQKLIAAVGDKD